MIVHGGDNQSYRASWIYNIRTIRPISEHSASNWAAAVFLHNHPRVFLFALLCFVSMNKKKYDLSIHCNLGHGRKKKGVGGSILGMCLFSVTCERCDIKAGKEKKKAHVANFNDFLYFFFFFWFLFFCRSAWTTATEVHAIYYIHIRHYLLQKGPLTCIREYIPTYTR